MIDWNAALSWIWPFILVAFGLGAAFGWFDRQPAAQSGNPELEAKLKKVQALVDESASRAQVSEAKANSLSNDYDEMRKMYDSLRADYDSKVGLSDQDLAQKAASLESAIRDKDAELTHMRQRLGKIEPELRQYKEMVASCENEIEGLHAKLGTKPEPRPMRPAETVVAVAEVTESAAQDLDGAIQAAVGTLAAVMPKPAHVDVPQGHTDLLLLEGVDEHHEARLIDAGIQSQEALLDTGKTRPGRKDVAKKSGIPESLILTWVNQVDLQRIPGVNPQIADLLEVIGVDTVPELARQSPVSLRQRLEAIKAEKDLVAFIPVQEDILGWVEEAKKLPRVVSH